MTWKCDQCGHETRATVVYPIRCQCGSIDFGDFTHGKPEFVSHQRRLSDVLAFMSRVPDDVTAVAGVPRSGMFAASILAEQLHLALYALNRRGLRRLSSGFRHRTREDNGRILILDDTVASGASLKSLPAIKRDHLLGAVYVSPERAGMVDLFHRRIAIPHYLEWNLFNSIYTPELGTDIDGILCRDPDPPWNDCKYEKFLQNAPILQRPVRDVLPLIATGRRRRYRQHTEQWLASRGIRYERLVFPATDEEHANPGVLKARAYIENRATIFVESEPEQAKLIAEISGKRVICPCVSQVWN